MKLKFLLWIAAAIVAVVGVFVFTSKDEKPKQEQVEVVETPAERTVTEPTEAMGVAEETPVISDEEKARIEAEERAKAEAEAKAKRQAAARAKAARIAKEKA